jgi:hypothetical protein
MTATTPCSRHPRGAWMPACPDCTAWHVEIALARCDQAVAAVTTARTADRSMGRPDETDVPQSAPPLAA